MRPITASKSPSNGPLVARTFSNKKFRERSRTQSRGRSRERSPSLRRIEQDFRAFDDDLGDDVGHNIIRSFSDDEGPDDIFDIQERYSGPTRGFSMGLIPGLATSEEESREDLDEDEQSNDDDDVTASFSTTSQDSSIEHENYLSKIMEKFQIRDIFDGLQKSTSGRMLQRAEPPQPTIREDPKTIDLKTRLRHEIERSKQLEEKLVSAQKRYASQISEHQSRIMALESKLALQERIFARQLEAERQKRIALSARAFDLHITPNENEGKASPR